MDALLRAGFSNTAWAAALALLAWCVTRLCRRRPALAHVLWLAVLLKLVTPPLVSAPFLEWPVAPRPISTTDVPSPTESSSPRVSPQLSAAPSTHTTHHQSATSVDALPMPFADSEPGSRPLPWRSLVVSVWLAGGVAWWLAVGLHAFRFRRFLGAAQPASAELRERVERLSTQLGLRGCPTLGLVPAQVPPMLWALFGQPRLLLPEALWERLSPAQQETVLAHELAHLKRRDHWVRRLEVLVLGLHWWNPLAWWARREIERAEEPCCDAWVTWALPDSAHDYAEALVATATFLSGPRSYRPIGASGVGCTHPLKRRLIMLLSDPPSRPWARSAPRAALLLVALSLPLLPVWAAHASDEPEEVPRPSSDTPQAKTVPPADAQSETAKADPLAPAAKLQFVHPIEREVSDYEEFTGRVEPFQSIEFVAKVSGAITQIHFAPGAIVKRGDLLLEIDARALQAELSRADADIQRAKARVKQKTVALTRFENLLKRNPDYVSKEEVLKTQAELEEAEAEVTAAQATRELVALRLESTRVTSPLDGRISSLLPAGNMAIVDKTIVATVVSLNPIAAAFDVDERTALRVGRLMREGKLPGAGRSELPVMMALVDEADFPHRGKVLSLNTVFDPGSGATRWRAVFSNADQSLVPGLFARIRILTSAPYKALLVPQTAVFRELDRPYVSVSLGRDGPFEKRYVTLGQAHGDLVIVREGRLSPQDQIYVPALREFQ